ncbi:bifunctional diaminohydroxyphosphoribosylaminopyrimidine deaminase/5-amino-6-(5-phosphoribosylamino)uracil reductase RibD [Azotosporobacter soli]|uniref:bifunctional diaminohydroxyphosphoribosylaminopyrimidine deaminase/5-amino-6-(5-phosphoribosylamino)uracil reductase RibD n=1 Tax=Azotosporobacter soli TaxID=3055040 RepID=UPI0031FEBB2A
MQPEFMHLALQLAKLAEGRTTPNPLVGAVIVKEGRVVGQGWHRKAGTAHAEIHALRQAGDLARGADIYVTLEPCSHRGRTGPCAKALAEAGVKRVFVAMLDPNPLVAGKGLAYLRQAGIEVVEGVLAAEAARQNIVFLKWISTGLPFVSLKTAMSLDGKVAAKTGHSQWITGSAARERVHHLRDCHDAILTGIGTVLKDDPQLTTRLPQGGKNPLRVIVDSHAQTPLTAKVVCDDLAQTIIAVTEAAPPERIEALRQAGVEVWLIKADTAGRIDLRALLQQLGKAQISSLLLEGGSRLNASFWADNLVDRVYWFIAPKVIGGDAAPGPIGGVGLERVPDMAELEEVEIEKIADDILISGDVSRREGRDVYRTCGRIR